MQKKYLLFVFTFLIIFSLFVTTFNTQAQGDDSDTAVFVASENNDNGDESENGSSGNECNECDGKVTTLTLQYFYGEDPAIIRVEQKKEGVIFEETVQPKGQFTIKGIDKKGTLGTEIIIFIDGQEHVQIHTSCSQPIGPGLMFGDFLILYGESRNGGPLCQETCIEEEGKKCPDPDIPEVSYPALFGLVGGGLIIGLLIGFLLGNQKRSEK